MSGQHPAPSGAGDFDRLALGYAQRRVILVASLLGGLCITGAGTVWALSSAVMGELALNGLVMAAVGAGVTALGWLASAWLRFTGKGPKPLDGGDKVEPRTRESLIGGWVAFGLVAAAALAAILLAPRGREPDTVAVLLMLATVPAVLLLGFYWIRRIMRSRDKLYARWLAKHPG